MLRLPAALSIRLTCLVLLLTACGCGSTEQKYAETTQPVEVKPVDNVRAILQGLSESGTLDSGVMVLGEYFDQMQAAGADVDKLKKDADELMKMSDPGKIKAKAKAMLAELPQ